MTHQPWTRQIALRLVVVIGTFLSGKEPGNAWGQEELTAPKRSAQQQTQLPKPALPLVPGTQPLPINLATALKLGNAQALDIAFAIQQEQVAAAQLEGSQVLWLPNLFLGPDYFRHDGQIQDVAGSVFGTSKSSFMVGVGPSMVFSFSDAIFAPLAA